MSVMNGTYSDGRVLLAAYPDWPDGTLVRVVPADETVAGMREEDFLTDPESIAAWNAWLDGLEPLILTPEDEARIRAARGEQLAFDHAAGNARADRLAADAG